MLMSHTITFQVFLGKVTYFRILLRNSKIRSSNLANNFEHFPGDHYRIVSFGETVSQFRPRFVHFSSFLDVLLRKIHKLSLFLLCATQPEYN